MKKKNHYFIATIAVVLILIRIAYYVLALGFGKKLESLKDISDNLMFLFFIYVAIIYARRPRKDKEE